MHPPAQDLLRWYDRHKRALPWRDDGAAPDPYRIWLSEVMLQQTTAAAVTPRFRRFLDRFPDVAALAAAPWEAVAAEWAGLGYYARARNLHAAARAVTARGGFPDTVEGLRALPGVGAYTAAAVAAIAFDRPAVPVDGNVERVCARVFAVREPLPGARPRLAALAGGFMAQDAARARPGDFAQALFDLGATLCAPRRPACVPCPWRAPCAGRREGVQDVLPAKSPKAARGLRHGAMFVLRDGGGRLLLRRRPPSGLLGGMAEFPGAPWRADFWGDAEALAHAPWAEAPLNAAPGPCWRAVPGAAIHGFTHMELRMRVFRADLPDRPPPPEGHWWEEAGAARGALPTAMRRVLDHAGTDAPAAGANPSPPETLLG